MVIKLLVLPVRQVIFFSSLFSLPPLLLVARMNAGALARLLPDLRRHYRFIFLLAGCLLLNLFLYFSAIRQTTIANAVFSHYTAPIFVAVMAPFFLQEAFDRWTGIALPLSLLGLFLLLFPDLRFTLSRGELLGVGLGVASGIAYAATVVVAKFLTRGISAISIAFWQGVFIVALLLPFVWRQPLAAIPGIDWLVLVGLGVFHSCLAPLLYVSGLRQVRAQYTAILGYLEPVSTVVMGIFILREIPGWVTVAGGILILGGGFLVIWKGSKRQHASIQ